MRKSFILVALAQRHVPAPAWDQALFNVDILNDWWNTLVLSE